MWADLMIWAWMIGLYVMPFLILTAILENTIWKD
jgi:hypothetical protein